MYVRLTLVIIGLMVTNFSVAQKRVQNALSFDGIDDIVRGQSNSSTNLNGSAFTVEAWVKPLNFQYEPYSGIIVSRHNEPSNRGFVLAAGGSGEVYFGVFDDSSAEITTASNTLAKNIWTHIAASFDRYVLRVYINGSLVDSLIDSTAVGNPGSIPLTMGNSHALDKPWWGDIDEVRLWSRAISGSEIAANYQRAYCGYSADLRAYYKFNKGRAGSRNTIFFRIPDWSSYNNEGVLYNFRLDGSISNYVSGYVPIQSALNSVDTVVACDQFRAPSLNNTWYQSGVYVDTVYSLRGCDSALRIYLTINKSTRDTLKIRACRSYTFPSGNQTTQVSGVFNDRMANSVGCDSLLTLLVRIGPDSTFFDTTVCSAFVLPYSKRSTKQSGIYTDTITNYLGCDSILFFNVTILPSSLTMRELQICDSVRLAGSNRWVYSAGIYRDTLMNYLGCDSIIQYEVKSLVTRAFYQDYACGQYESPSKKYIWTQSGVYLDTLVNSKGCDSIIQVTLEVSPVSDTVLKVQACRRYRVPSRRYFIYESGTYFDTIMNAYGCDSVIQIEAQITHFDNALVTISDTVRAKEGYSNYQWLRCDKSFEIVPDETQFELVVKEPGDYAVRMEENGCADTSECVNVTQNGTSIFQNVKFNVYPNPSGGRLFIEGENLDASYVEVRDLNSRIIQVVSFMNGYEGKQFIDIDQKGWFYLILTKDQYREVVPVLIE